MPLSFLPFLPRRSEEDSAENSARPLRIVVTGAECTGKTTLAKALAQRLGAPFVQEAARLYAEEHAPRELTEADVEPIARLHLSLAERAEAGAESVAQGVPLVVCDTDLVSTVTYARHLYGEDAVPAWLAQAAEERRADLYLLCTPEGVAWEPDPGQRAETAEVRAATQPAFADALGVLRWLHGTRTVTLSGPPRARLLRAAQAVAQVAAEVQRDAGR